MPTYEYRCPAGHEFELIQKISDKPRAKCPECGKVAVRMISGGAGLLFKGSGFYITDYGKDGKGPRKETEKGEKGGASEAKSEAKPAPADKQKDKPASKPAGGKASE